MSPLCPPGSLTPLSSFPFCSILIYICLYYFFFPLRCSLGGWISGGDPREEEDGNRESLKTIPFCLSPTQAVNVSCCPPAPQTLVNTGASVSLLQVS